MDNLDLEVLFVMNSSLFKTILNGKLTRDTTTLISFTAHWLFVMIGIMLPWKPDLWQSEFDGLHSLKLQSCQIHPL